MTLLNDDDDGKTHFPKANFKRGGEFSVVVVIALFVSAFSRTSIG